MLYGSEVVAVMTKLLETELGMMQILLGVSWMDRMQNKSVRETTQVGGFGNTVK